MKHICPVCHKTINETTQERAEHTKFLPFCSQQCKLIDLGAWLDGEYKIISESQSQKPQSDNPTDTHSNNR